MTTLDKAYWLLWNCRCSRGDACLGKQLPQIQNTEFIREVFHILATESDKTELDLASYRFDSQNSFKEHPIVEVLKLL
jgi:hypothetical protein